MGLLEWLQDPRRTQAMQGIGSAIQSGLLGIQQGHQRFQDLQKQAFADPTNPAKVTNPQAMNELAQMGMGLLSFAPAGLTVFHGSPYPFKKFDPTKIGSGEGAQAYGYGHYVAENPAVASEYQNTLRDIGYSYNGKKIDKLKYPVREVAAKLLYESKGDMSSAIKAADRYAYDDLLKKELLTMDASKVSIGNLYKIDLPDEQIAKMLDWDKPIKDQKEVLSAIRNQINDDDIVKSFDANVKSGISGANAMQNYVWGKTPAEKSEALRQAGVPGIRYLDQGSRNIEGGTSNFVVFPGNEDLLRILERNNQPIGLLETAQPKFNVTSSDASEIFGAGAKRVRYQDPASNGFIDVLQKPDGTASVLGLEVPEVSRGKGIGQSLQQQVLQDFPEMQGQVSSKAAAKTAYRLGRRPPGQPEATLDDVYRLMDENSSVNLVSPEMQKRFLGLLE